MRNEQLSILKGFGIILMVVGHSGAPDLLHDFVYLFHMALFYYASGYFFKPDEERFEQYLRFKPDIKLEYVYYYDTCANELLDKRYPGMSLREKMVEVCKIYDLDTNKFLTPAEIRAKIDLSSEGNTFIRQMVRENGEKTCTVVRF